MRTINTTVKTGSTFLYNNRLHTVGRLRYGKIDVNVKIDKTSSCDLSLTTRALNNLLRQSTDITI